MKDEHCWDELRDLILLMPFLEPSPRPGVAAQATLRPALEGLAAEAVLGRNLEHAASPRCRYYFPGPWDDGFDEKRNPTSWERSRSAWRTIASVPYDEDLAVRIREIVGSETDLTEKKMFGGLAFLIRGNMAVAASGQGGVLVRVDPATSDKLVATTNAYPMEMRGRTMKGWLRVDAKDVRTKRELARWVRLGATYARSLPGKR